MGLMLTGKTELQWGRSFSAAEILNFS